MQLADLRGSLADCIVCGCLDLLSGEVLALSTDDEQTAQEVPRVVLAAGEIFESWISGAGAELLGTQADGLSVALMHWRQHVYFVFKGERRGVAVVFGYPGDVSVAMALTEAKANIAAVERASVSDRSRT